MAESLTNHDKLGELPCSREKVSMLSSRVLDCQKEIAASKNGGNCFPLTDSFIADYLPFVKSLVRTYVKNIKKYDFDSLVSIASEAFWYTIKVFSPEKGAFVCFAAVVIKRRLLNEVSSQNSTTKREVVFSDLAVVGDEGNEAPFDVSDGRSPCDNPLKWEIEAIRAESLQYGIDYFRLKDCSPKAKKTKLACFAAVKHLIHSDELLQSMRRKSALPLKELNEATGVDRKTLERHRQYIMVVALIGTDDYPYLQSWLSLREYGVLP